MVEKQRNILNKHEYRQIEPEPALKNRIYPVEESIVRYVAQFRLL